MVQAAMQSGAADRPSVFELFARKLPAGRRYGVVAGVGRALRALADFRFGDEELQFLRRNEVVDETTAEWLAEYRFSGNIWGYPEGELYFPSSPLVVVEGTFAEAVLLETLLLSIYNHDSAIASAASRMVLKADGRPCIEMGSRRAHEEAAVAAARAAWIAGFGSSSNLAAGRRWGIPTAGTAAHSFTLLHDSEQDAFEAQIQALGETTTLLVDTYDIAEAVRVGVELTGGRIGAVRLDSGDLATVARDVRAQLDSLGAHDTKIIVTSDLDEWQIAALQAAPVDGYGVGTALVTGSGHPTSKMVYKLVSRAASAEGPQQPVEKLSKDKGSVGGRKFALRRLNEQGVATAEVIGVGQAPAGDNNDRPLLVPLVVDGEVVGEEPLAAARERHQTSLAEMPRVISRMSPGDPAIPTVYVT